MGTSGLQPFTHERHLAHTQPQRCRQLQKLSHTHRRQAKRPSVTVAVADTRSNAPQLPEGSFGLPFIGESREWLKDMPGFFADRHQKHGPVFKSRLFGEKTVVVADPMQICRILQGEDKLAEIAMPSSWNKLLPDSLLSIRSEKHRQARRTLTPAYAESSMRLYHTLMLEVVSSTLKKSMEGGPFRGYTMCRALAFDVAAAVLLGTRWDSATMSKLRMEFTVFVQGAFGALVPYEIPGTRFKRAKDAQRYLNSIVAEVIADGRKQLNDNHRTASEEGSGKRRQRTALQVMLEARDDDGNPLTDEALQDQIVTQMFAGHETTAGVMTRMLQLLKGSPEVLQQLRHEQDSLIDQHGAELTADVADQMPFVDAVIKETIRLYDPATVLFRRALEDILVDGNLVIPKGWTIQLHLAGSQRNIKAFEANATEFMPERFLSTDNKLHRKEPAGYAPWGAGPRKCLGMPLATAELRVFLAVLARDYEWECNADEKWVTAEKQRPENFLMTKFSAQGASSKQDWPHRNTMV